MPYFGINNFTKPKPRIILNKLHPLSRGLIGLWLFNEGTGSLVNDISGNTNHGLLNNTSPNTQGSGWGGSRFGGGLYFDGVNDHINCGDADSLDKAFTQLTISAWIYTNNNEDAWAIVMKSASSPSNNSYGLAFSGAANRLFMLAAGVAGLDTRRKANSAINTGKWYHVCGVFDGSKATNTNDIYINGINDNGVLDGVIPDAVIPNNLSFRIGSSSNDIEHMNGQIDIVQIYNRALLASEVKILYEQPYCNLLQIPIQRYAIASLPIMNLFKTYNLGADLYNGTLL